MSREFSQLRQFEKEYYKRMPTEVYELTQLRNKGKDLLAKSGGIARKLAEGCKLLEASAEGLDEAAQEAYRREAYASLYMYSRGLCVAGNIHKAGRIAERAVHAEPGIPDDIDLPASLVADQYVAIASAPLAAVLSASLLDTLPVALVEDDKRSKLADQVAKRAVHTCVWSENRTRMIFADGAMSDEDRAKARIRHAAKATAATALLLVPTQEARVWVARRICKF